MKRRAWIKLAGVSGLGCLLKEANAEQASSLFDGRTLDGWSQVENSATSVSSGGIADPAAFVAKLTSGADAMSQFLRGGMDDPLKADLAAYTPSAANAKAVISALVKYLNQVVEGPAISKRADLAGIDLRDETKRLLAARPQGQTVLRLNKLLLEDAYPHDLEKSASTGWIVKDGAMASTGSGRGVIYTAKDYNRYRLMFTMRHISGNPDHQACVLVFCSRPLDTAKPLDALGGIQFQVPNGGHWDYRPGMNNAGGAEFTSVNKVRFDVHEWSRVEILADASKGVARMAVAQPVGAKAVEVLAFRDAAAGRPGPIAWQMHNAGLFDEYKDITIEVNPEKDELSSVR